MSSVCDVTHLELRPLSLRSSHTQNQCAPGLCCLADEGTSAAFSVPGKAGEVVTLEGCRSPSNEDQCIEYLPCSGVFVPAAADLKVSAAATEALRNSPRQAYSAAAFVALAVLLTLAAVRRRRRGAEGRVRRRSLGEYEEIRLLDDAEDDEGTKSPIGRSEADNGEDLEAPSLGSDDEEEEEGDIENPTDESQQRSRDDGEVISRPEDRWGWSHKKFFGS